MKNTALHDGLLYVAFIFQAVQLGQDPSAARRLSADGNILRIPAERRNIPLRPEQAVLLIQISEIGGRLGRFLPQLRVRQEAEHIQPVIYRHHHNAAACQTLSVKLHLRRVSPLQPAAKIPYIHGQFIRFAHSGCPHIQVQAVFIHGNGGIHIPFPCINIFFIQPRDALHGNGRKFQAVPDSFPVSGRLRRPPAQLSHRRFCIGHTTEYSNPRILSHQSMKHSVFYLNLS